MEKNIEGKSFFNFKSFQMLAEKTKGTEDYDIIEDVVKSCTNYVSDVDVGEAQIKRFYATLEGDDLREKVVAVDQRRRRHHEDAITSCKLINRFAELNKIDPVFVGDEADRLQIADFCLEVTVTLFNNRSL